MPEQSTNKVNYYNGEGRYHAHDHKRDESNEIGSFDRFAMKANRFCPGGIVVHC